jgi:hypothetical protein
MEKYNVCVREEDLFVCAGSVRQSGASSEGAEHIQRKRGEQRHTHIQTTATDRCTYKKDFAHTHTLHSPHKTLSLSRPPHPYKLHNDLFSYACY